MALSQEQYDGLMRQYSETRLRHERELSERKRRIAARIPAYNELDHIVPAEGVSRLRQLLASKNEAVASEAADMPAFAAGLHERAAQIKAGKRALLKQYGYPEDYLDPIYDCPACRDTGYISDGKCRCLLQKEADILYHQSHLKEIVKSENFSALSEEFYQGEDLGRFRKTVEGCRRFVNEFGNTYINLYFYGTVGTGKSFLSACVADSLLKQGHSVLYFSAASLFDRLAALSFGKQVHEELEHFTHELYHCDLLIIDDLGTELTNAFVAASLFTCLNERQLNRKSVVISTNLSLAELQSRYSDRVFSRIANYFELYKLTGPDIRVLKRRK